MASPTMPVTVLPRAGGDTKFDGGSRLVIAPPERSNVNVYVNVNKMIFLIHHISGSLLRCVYHACPHRNDDENTIYQSALVTICVSYGLYGHHSYYGFFST